MGMLPEHEAMLKRFQTKDERKKQRKDNPKTEPADKKAHSYKLPEYHPQKPFIIRKKYLPREVKASSIDVKNTRFFRNLYISTGAIAVPVTAFFWPAPEAAFAAVGGGVFANMRSDDIREIHKEVEDGLASNGDFVKQKVRASLNGSLPLPSELEKTHPHFLVGRRGELIFLPKNAKIELVKQKIHDAKEKVPILKNLVPLRYRGVTKFSR